MKEWDAVLAGQVSRVDQIAFNTLVAQVCLDPLPQLLRNFDYGWTLPAGTSGAMVLSAWKDGGVLAFRSLHQEGAC